MNAQVASREVSESRAAADFLWKKFSIDTQVEDISATAQVWQRTLEHCDLVRRSLIPAIFVAIPLGIFAAKFPRAGQLILGIELPLASASILAGIKTAAVLNVGFATLGALVGARGYGQPIHFSGFRLAK